MAVQMMIGSGCVSMMRRVASKPSRRGMWMSMTTTSGRWAPAARKSSAACPSFTAPITRMPGSEFNSSTSSMRVTCESSATSTLILSAYIFLRLREPAQRFQQIALIEIALHQVGVGADIDAPFAVLA